MKHSNNAARIRIWRELKGATDLVERRVVTYPDLQSEEFIAVNPLKKVPAVILGDGRAVMESFVILEYLEDKYGPVGPSFKPDTPEGRAAMGLLIRMHDLYIASPNCTQPGFTHTQGCMYLSLGWHGPARGMDVDTRAAKCKELWKHLNWLEANIEAGPWMCGEQLTLADMTWFPTFIFIEYLAPKVFGWAPIFEDPSNGFPKLTKWFQHAKKVPAFADTRTDIWEYWEAMDAEGQFLPIQEEVAANPQHKWLYTAADTTSTQ